jgi:hypothetical protein
MTRRLGERLGFPLDETEFFEEVFGVSIIVLVECFESRVEEGKVLVVFVAQDSSPVVRVDAVGLVDSGHGCARVEVKEPGQSSWLHGRAQLEQHGVAHRSGVDAVLGQPNSEPVR